MLTFITTMSLDDFKEIKKAESVEVRQNPQTGKFFFICGDATGAVSHRFTTEGKEAVVSEVEKEDGDTFFLLHNRADNTQAIIYL